MNTKLIPYDDATPEQIAQAVIDEWNSSDPRFTDHWGWTMWTDSAKSALKSALIERLRDGWRAPRSLVTASAVGVNIRDTYSRIIGEPSGHWTEEMNVGFGQALIDIWNGLKNSGVPVPDDRPNVGTDPSEQMRSTFPEAPVVRYGSGTGWTWQYLLDWAENGGADIKDTVDAQAGALEPHVWPRTIGGEDVDWHTTGPAKEFLGEVMKYKRWLLASAPVIGDTPHVVHATPGTALNRANDRVADLERQLRDEQAAHANDMKTVERVLRTQAKRRDWCSEFESVVDDVLNPRLAIPINSDRDGETMKYRVTWSETYTVTVNRTGEYECDSEDDAKEYATEEDSLTDRQLADEIITNVDPEVAERMDYDVTLVED